MFFYITAEKQTRIYHGINNNNENKRNRISRIIIFHSSDNINVPMHNS